MAIADMGTKRPAKPVSVIYITFYDSIAEAGVIGAFDDYNGPLVKTTF